MWNSGAKSGNVLLVSDMAILWVWMQMCWTGILSFRCLVIACCNSKKKKISQNVSWTVKPNLSTTSEHSRGPLFTIPALDGLPAVSAHNCSFYIVKLVLEVVWSFSSFQQLTTRWSVNCRTPAVCDRVTRSLPQRYPSLFALQCGQRSTCLMNLNRFGISESWCISQPASLYTVVLL
jgi:hypothetical protein